MNQKPHLPDPETSNSLLVNLRQTRLEMAEFNLELAQINARLERDIRQQRSKRLGRSRLSEG